MREPGDPSDEWGETDGILSSLELLLGSGTMRAEEKNVYRVGELLREFGIARRTLRLCEDRGIVSPNRLGTKRTYSRRDRLRLRYALLGRSLGFSPAEARQLADLYVKPSR